jgi:hypothetical protein
MTSMPPVPPQGPSAAPDFTQEVYELIRDTAPRLFGVVAEYRVGTDDADAVVVAWGMAYEDGQAEVVSVTGDHRLRLASPAHITRHLGPAGEDRSFRLVWLAPSGTDGDAGAGVDRHGREACIA